jgi:ligand-binding sensor domain-containing protein
MNRFLPLLAIFTFSTVFAQVGMQDWRIHFSSFKVVGIAESGPNVYMACSNGIVDYDTDDNSIELLTVTNGLSDLGISSISSNSNVVVVGYSNGNLDIIEGNTITNIPWIEKAEISGNKEINSIYFDGNLIYVASNIGLVVIDNAKKEVRDTYYPYDDPVINDVTIFDDTIFCATPLGIYQAHKNQAFLNDKNQWTQKSNLPLSLLGADIDEIESFGDKLLFAYNSSLFEGDSLYFFQNGVLSTFSGNPLEINSLHADQNELILCTFGSVQMFDQNIQETNLIFQIEEEPPLFWGGVSTAGNYWLADQNHGLVKAVDSWTNSSVFSNTPFTDGSYRIDVQFGTVLVAGGGLTHNLQNNFFRNGVYKFQDETWTNYNSETQDSMDINTNWDFISVVVNPDNTNELAFGSSSQGGLMVVRDGSNVTEVYTEFNSPIESVGGRTVVSDMKYDNDGNLWMVNQGVEPLKMLTPQGQWYTFSMGSAAKNAFPYRLLIDQKGNKWVGFNQVGLIAFDDNGTLDDGSDDQWRTLSASEGYGNLPTLFPKAIAEDIDGEIWIGTDLGMVVLYNTNDLYDGGFGEYDANAILIEVDGEVEKLLGESDITTITIDGGNRKWIGTSSSGVFCFSEDGTEEIYRYTKENSPLISNNILDIRVDHLSGEVFFATENGLVSVRTDATIGDAEFSNVTVFPNPVRPEYSGPITIQGLGYESDVKITDVSGNLVYKSVSNGGTVIWNGQTLQGERAKSGVYLVWTAVSSGKGRNVAKLVLIN